MADHSPQKRDAIHPAGNLRKLWLFRGFLVLVLVLISILGWYSLTVRDDQTHPGSASSQEPFPGEIALSSPTGIEASPVEATASQTPQATRTTIEGTLIYTLREAGYSHIWAHAAGDPMPIPLTWGTWDDRDPAIDPLGRRLAFASNRSGPWDLYLLDLVSGEVRQLTTTPGYEGHPTWSPDGMWIAFEANYDGDNDIRILSVEGGQEPIQLTDHPASDTQPVWDPAGRRIAFVSDREGSPDIFIANLDQPDNRYLNLTQTTDIHEGFPSFSPDSTWLAYSKVESGLPTIQLVALADPGQPAIGIGSGEFPVWSPDGNSLAAILPGALRTHLVSYAVDQAIPLVGFPVANSIYQLAWTAHGLPGEVSNLSLGKPPLSPLYEIEISPSAGTSRLTLAPLSGVTAPNPALSDAVDEAFSALRQRVTHEAGWDFLASLDNAFVGINDPLPPGLSYDDWLYTGRAFTFVRDAVEAGFVEVVREDLGGQTYWRVYIRTAKQDGTQGEPLRKYPWEFNARFSGNPQAYDQGGSEAAQLPRGYYIDFTQLALDYGFERLPALANWRTYFPGARFGQFIFRQGLDWLDAMLELYPLSAIVTPTPFLTPTPTPTRTLRPTPTPWWWRWGTPTFTPTPFIPSTPTP